ncbi:HSP20-like chaperones superfamily protein [Perilla frutescens var. hirtella]|nr:HSP20-like chaperones superfamily protein [Perilla frutescens var. frutescens]KAH6787231.1 HSP20-like chaperones superfamily protein [Perilla frutescens var. hirtella]
MSLIPSFFGNRRSNVFDPFSLDIWDPFEGFPLSTAVANFPSSAREATAVANAHIDWKETPEAHVIKVDVPGLKKRKLRLRLRMVAFSRSVERETRNRRRRTTSGTASRGAAASSSAASGCRRMPNWSR